MRLAIKRRGALGARALAALSRAGSIGRLSDSLFDQRSRELFLEGQHLFDLVRFGKTPGPTAGTAYAGGGVYGSQLCLPLPDVEKQNNPNFP